MNKTIIKKVTGPVCSQHVYIKYYDMFDNKVEMELFVSTRGGYVQIYDPERGYPQICKKLKRRGNTLSCSGDLLDVVRREYRKMRYEEKKELQRLDQF